jgi:glycosyltransferase involved in cell wall biosynthesis
MIELKIKGNTLADIAVIMTSYGRDNLLEKAIKSVTDQTHRNLLLLIVDDNSSEINARTTQIIEQNASIDSRISYFQANTSNEERANVSTFARNINYVLERIKLNEFNVKYVCYLPCDDFYYPNKIKEVVKFLSLHPIINSCYNYIQVTGRMKYVIPTDRVPVRVDNAVTNLDHSCVAHKTSLLSKLSNPYWPENKLSEHGAPDGVFFNKLIEVGGSIYPIGPAILGEKLQHRNSIQGRKYGW